MKPFLIAIAILAAGAMALPVKAAPTKKQVTTSNISFATSPIDPSIEQLPPKYRGHSILELFQKIKPPQERREFEKTEEYEARVARWKSSPILGSILPTDLLAFELSEFMAPDVLSLAYDADNEQLNATISFTNLYFDGESERWLETYVHSKDLGSHIGVTGMGVKIRVKTILGTHVGLGVTEPLERQISFSKSLPREDARKLKPHLTVFAIASLVPPYKGDIQRTKTASLTDPIEVIFKVWGLHVSLKALWLVNRTTGEIIMKSQGPFATCRFNICTY